MTVTELIAVHQDQTIWDWIFESPKFNSLQKSPEKVGGYVNTKTKQRLGYGEVKELATYLSMALYQDHNIRAGDRVIIFSENSIWYPVAMFGTIRLGGIASGASPFHSINEMSQMIQVARPAVIFASLTHLPVALSSAKVNGMRQEQVILLEGRADGTASLANLISRGKEFAQTDQVPSYQVAHGKTNGDVCAFLGFSSGTTGHPKGVMLSHKNVIAQCLQLRQVTVPGLTRTIAALPFFHVTGLVHSLNFPAAQNMEVAILPEFTMKGMLEALVEYQIEELLLVPPIVIRLVQEPIVDQYDLSRLKRFFCGAAPLSKSVIAQLRAKFPHTGFKQGYGMTESCSAVTLCPPEMYSYDNAHTVGVLLGSTELKIIGEDGRELGVNEPGEILLRGPQVAMGYWKNPKATAATFDAEGFLHSGDQGMIDASGLVTITDRLKELIKVKGVGVAPAELEDLLLSHASVEDCGVVAMPDERAGERPQAFVVTKGCLPSPQLGHELMELVRKSKAREKWIHEIVFVDSIPKSASGKILRRQLRMQPQDAKLPRGLTVRWTQSQARL
ncbi:uncharacterized protein N7477_005169 [Penicillium maclennaniae]|uniref:uncharacterized protein n=1 Tax=Penicillium maclennaniae TaxID=1343394 RepID=UPI00253FDA59|nr:uncharacterized protein N7477_005169 [Penicillium maclennaniae]KAJ5675235.1 hypothetical protein N7477_005169 [Penicillium maclennaniae]